MNKKVKYPLIILVFLLLVIFLFSNFVFAATPTNNYIYNIYNYASGKCLNVNYGTDANGTNVTQYTKDGSLEQRFKLVYNSSRSSYKLHAMCSSNGTNRVLDILRTGGSASGSIVSGCNVDIWSPNDNDAQDFIITNRGNGYYSLHPRVNTSLALTTNGTGNGSGAGTSSGATGNVYVSSYTGSNYQLWRFRETNANCYWYEGGGLTTGAIVNTDSDYYNSRMGYKTLGYKNNNSSNFLNVLSNSDIYIYDGHGSPGELVGNGSQTPILSSTLSYSQYSISSLTNGSLNDVKLAIFYACNSGTPSTNPFASSIVDAVHQKGAKCVIGWDCSVYIDVKTEWNTIFLESLYNKNTINSAITYANAEVLKILGIDPTAANTMINDIVSTGLTNQTIY